MGVHGLTVAAEGAGLCGMSMSTLRLAQDEQWRGIEWLFHNARGQFAEASTALAALVRDGDRSGHSSGLLVPPCMSPAALPARAALLNKATLLLLKRRSGAASHHAADAPAAVRQHTSLGSMGGPAQAAAVTREYDEAEVMLAVLRLRMRVSGVLGSCSQAGSGEAAPGLVRPGRPRGTYMAPWHVHEPC